MEIFIGVESTAHTFGVGVVANVKDSYTSADGGMIPDKVALHHKEVAERIREEAFSVAGIAWGDVSFIAYSAGPGLDPALWAGYNIVKVWSEKEGKKIVGVNHCCAHLSIGKVWNKLEDACYLYVSGVNTQVIVETPPTVAGREGKYLIIGETLDIGLGNMLDKFGRVLGLGFPAGAAMEKLALQGKYVELPMDLAGDQGAMIAWEGFLRRETYGDVEVRPHWRTDEV